MAPSMTTPLSLRHVSGARHWRQRSRISPKRGEKQWKTSCTRCSMAKSLMTMYKMLSMLHSKKIFRSNEKRICCLHTLHLPRVTLQHGRNPQGKLSLHNRIALPALQDAVDQRVPNLNCPKF